MVDPTHRRKSWGEQGLHLEGQVIEEGGVCIPEGLLVVAGFGEQAHPLHEVDVEPGLQPEAHAQAQGAVAEILGRGVGEGHLLVKAAPGLGLGAVVEQVGVQLKGDKTTIENPPLHAHPGQVLGPGLAVEQEGVAEVGRVHLAAPGSHRPGEGVPVRQRRQGWAAADRFRRRQRRRGELGEIQILLTAVKIEHPIHIVHFAPPLQQAEAQPAGLEVLLTPLKAHAAAGQQLAGGGIEFDPIGHDATPGQERLHVARGHVAAELGVVALAVGAEFKLQRR